MDVVSLTRRLVDIESISGNEGAVGNALAEELRGLGYSVQRMVVEGERANVYATSPQEPNPAVVFSTHMDTVPPFIPSSEDRVATTAAFTGAGLAMPRGLSRCKSRLPKNLKKEGIYVGLLLLVGEERDSRGAKVANQQANSVQVSDERRADGEPRGDGVEGRAAGATDSGREDGAFGLSGAGRVGD